MAVVLSDLQRQAPRAVQELRAHTTPVTGEPYTPSNVTTVRSFDADLTTVDELADVVGTLMAALQTKGLIG